MRTAESREHWFETHSSLHGTKVLPESSEIPWYPGECPQHGASSAGSHCTHPQPVQGAACTWGDTFSISPCTQVTLQVKSGFHIIPHHVHQQSCGQVHLTAAEPLLLQVMT